MTNDTTLWSNKSIEEIAHSIVTGGIRFYMAEKILRQKRDEYEEERAALIAELQEKQQYILKLEAKIANLPQRPCANCDGTGTRWETVDTIDGNGAYAPFPCECKADSEGDHDDE